jgi:hypothetical protein
MRCGRASATLGGRCPHELLALGEPALDALGGRLGDNRDWQEIESWGHEIARGLLGGSTRTMLWKSPDSVPQPSI